MNGIRNVECAPWQLNVFAPKHHDLKEIKLAKGQIVQRKGDLNTKVYEVKSGLLRSYSIDEKGKEHVYMFAPENWIVADSSFPDKPGELFIEALEEAVVIEREKDMTAIADTTKLVRRLEVLQKRIILLMSATAIERYEYFIETYPDITQRVPQKMIASYLGMTPEALSTVKRLNLREK